VPLDATEIADEIEAELRSVGTAARAENQKRYLKSDLEFLGLTVGEIRRVSSSFARDHPDLAHVDLVAQVEELWRKPVFDRRLASVFLLGRYQGLLDPDDLALLERLIRDSRTWALVDGLAANVTGDLLLRFPDAAGALDRWAVDEDFWLRRSALLALMEQLKAGADMERFGRYADAMLQEREFFVRKAIGWVLRDVSKRRPDEVWEWIAPRAARASGVTIREAAKYLGSERGSKLLAAYKARRPAL